MTTNFGIATLAAFLLLFSHG